MGPKTKKTKSLRSTTSRATSRKGAVAADKYDALEAEIALLNSLVLLFDSKEDAVKVSILSALNEFVQRCNAAVGILSRRQVAERILPYLHTKNQDMALQTVLLLNSLVESSSADLRTVKSFTNIEILLNPFMKPHQGKSEGGSIALHIATLTLLTHLCEDFRFLTKLLALNPIPTLCTHLKNTNQEIKKLSLRVLTMLSIDWQVKSQITSINEFTNITILLLSTHDPEVLVELFTLLKSLCRLEKNRDWFRDRKLLESSTTLLISEPDDDVLEAAFEALDEALKMPKNLQFLKDKGLLAQLLERSVDASEALQVAVCQTIALTAEVASNRKIYRDLEIEKTLGEIMRKEEKSFCSGSKAVSKLSANGLLRQSLGTETLQIVARGLTSFTAASNDECFTICLETLLALLQNSSENVRLFVEGKNLKSLLKITSGFFKRSVNASFTSAAAAASATASAATAAAAAVFTTTEAQQNASAVTAAATVASSELLRRNRLLCLEVLREIGAGRPEEVARKEVFALMPTIMAPEHDAELKEMATKIMICASMAYKWEEVSPVWVERGGIAALLKLLEEKEQKCRNVAAILLSQLLAPKHQKRDEKLKEALIDCGCVEALQRVVASPQHELWPNPREREALEDSVAASLPAAWAWRGKIKAHEKLCSPLPFWDGGGAEEGEEKWFKSLAQTKKERPYPDGNREVVLISLSQVFLDTKIRFLQFLWQQGGGRGGEGVVEVTAAVAVATAATTAMSVKDVGKEKLLAMIAGEEVISSSSVEGEGFSGHLGSGGGGGGGGRGGGDSGSSAFGSGVDVQDEKEKLRSFPMTTLDGICAFALTSFIGVMDPLFRAQGAALLVASELGGATSEDAPNFFAIHIAELKLKLRSNIIPMEALKMGGKRHRALLFKLFCDVLLIPCTLERGFGLCAEMHAWNTISVTLNVPTVPRLVEVSNEFGEFVQTRLQKRTSDVGIDHNINYEAIESSLSSSSSSLHSTSACNCCQACQRPEEQPFVPEAKTFYFVVDLMRHPGTLYEQSSLYAKEYRGGKVW